MGEQRGGSGLAWGVLVLRVVLGGIMVAHGFIRLFPGNVEKAASDLVFPQAVLGAQASLVIVGAGEIFVGLLVLTGFFLRLALIPLIAYLVANVVHSAKTQPLISPSGSSAEEYLILLLIALALLGLGPGRISLERFFREVQ